MQLLKRLSAENLFIFLACFVVTSIVLSLILTILAVAK